MGGGGRSTQMVPLLHSSPTTWFGEWCQQVRCLIAVLLMVGRGHEGPDIVARLLDVAATPCKPQFKMADEVGG